MLEWEKLSLSAHLLLDDCLDIVDVVLLLEVEGVDIDTASHTYQVIQLATLVLDAHFAIEYIDMRLPYFLDLPAPSLLPAHFLTKQFYSPA